MRRLLAACLAVWALISSNISTSEDAEIMAKMMWGECRGIDSKMEQAATAWCVLNRVDDERWGDTIREVITQPHQFTGYRPSNPVDPELLELAQDVIDRWQAEKDGQTDVGRVLPKEYTFFAQGGGGHNNFSETWPISKIWDWSLDDPYGKEEEDGVLSESGHRDTDGLGSDSGEPVYRDGRGRSNGYPVCD